MAGLFVYQPETPEGKYLVKRRDGTVPEWPSFVLGARDPRAWKTLLHYAQLCEDDGLDPAYVAGLRFRAGVFAAYLAENGEGDPDAPRHRKDDPATVAEMRKGRGS